MALGSGGHTCRREQRTRAAAASRIAARWRGNRYREELERERDAATFVIARWRGRACRRAAWQMQLVGPQRGALPEPSRNA